MLWFIKLRKWKSWKKEYNAIQNEKINIQKMSKYHAKILERKIFFMLLLLIFYANFFK